MPRSDDEKRRRAIKYGRRRRLLEADQSARERDAAVKRLLADLRKSAVPKAEQEELIRALRAVRDDTRRRAAIWAIVDALERVETP